jgi:uncharacterized protein YndB with AHSA1/START domain
MSKDPITVKATIKAPAEKVWEYWSEPEHIVRWAFASEDWEAPSVENDLRVGGKFKTVMAAKDKSNSFDFVGTYTKVEKNKVIEYAMDDGRHVKISFESNPLGVLVIETFDPENENSLELQKAGWQAIPNNFKEYAEGHK